MPTKDSLRVQVADGAAKTGTAPHRARWVRLKLAGMTKGFCRHDMAARLRTQASSRCGGRRWQAAGRASLRSVVLLSLLCSSMLAAAGAEIPYPGIADAVVAHPISGDAVADPVGHDPRVLALAEALSRSDLAAAAALELELLTAATSTEEASSPDARVPVTGDPDPEGEPGSALTPSPAAELLMYLNTGLLTSQGTNMPPLLIPTQRSLVLLGNEVPPGLAMRLSWSPGVAYEGLEAPTPVLVVNGVREGPTLCLTAAVHGDELNGIEIVRRVMHGIEPEELSGAVIGVPIVNLQGFHRGSRYLPDRRDLNRHFPGSPSGSAAARIAHSLLNEIVRHCSALVDIHTGSFHRTNLPQIRADLKNTAVLEFTQGFGALVVLQSAAAVGTLRRAATDAGVPTVTLEIGEPLRIQVGAVDEGVKSIASLLHSMDMYASPEFWDEPKPVYYESRWIRADHGGILLAEVELGDSVSKGDRLGTVIDPISNLHGEIRSPVNGRVLGMAVNQFVMPGYAAFRIGVEARVPRASPNPAPAVDAPSDDHTDAEEPLEPLSLVRLPEIPSPEDAD
jgi:uncharacterized protein